MGERRDEAYEAVTKEQTPGFVNFIVRQSVSYFTVPPRAHPSTGSQIVVSNLHRRVRSYSYHLVMCGVAWTAHLGAHLLATISWH